MVGDVEDDGGVEWAEKRIVFFFWPQPLKKTTQRKGNPRKPWIGIQASVAVAID